jgi:hypothetical protein
MSDDVEYDRIEAELDALSNRIERVRVLYEQFFLGMEKLPPRQLHHDVVRMVHDMSHAKLRSAQQKFRLQGLIQRFNSHKSYWQRSMREWEEGKHPRQLQKVRQREQAERRGDTVELSAAEYAAVAQVRESQGEAAARQAEDARLEAKRREKAAEAAAANEFLNQLMGSAGTDSTGRIQVVEAPPARAAEPDSAATAAGRPAQGASPSAEGIRGMSAADLAARVQPAAGSGAAPATAPTAAPEPGRGMSANELAERAARLREMANRLRTQAAGGATTTTSPGGSPTAPSAPPVGSATDARARQVYEMLLQTKSKLNEDTSRLSYDSFYRSMQKQAEVVREKHQCRDVDFDVVVKEGKAFLKPIPR